MNRPFFSILIPVYNVEKYLSVCLESVLQQSFTDYEIILVDDGSKDSSGQICDEYAVRYPNIIRVLHKENQGQISARVAGLQLAKGNYVCFLDSDDCWMENTLSRLHDTIEETNSDVVLFCWNRIDECGKVLSDTIPALFPQQGTIGKKIVFERMLSTALINPLWAKCSKLELFDIDTDYSNFYKIQNGEDLIQSLPVLYRANSFYYLAEPLYLYRVNTASITHVYRKGQHQTMNIVRPLLYSYLEKLGLDSEENKVSFFHFYLSSLWESIQSAYNGISSIEERESVLDDLRSYVFVKRGKEYLGICALPKQAHLGLSVFYKSNNKVMNTYMGIYLPVIKALRGAKAALRKLLN